MATTKVTFSLDAETVERIARTAQRLGASKSSVVREAVREYAARAGRLSEEERRRMLATFDRAIARIPSRPAPDADRELAAVRAARRAGGRGTRSRS